MLTTELYTLSLHDALPISFHCPSSLVPMALRSPSDACRRRKTCRRDRKSTRLNSSHANISYAVFYLKKKLIIKADAITINRMLELRDTTVKIDCRGCMATV